MKGGVIGLGLGTHATPWRCVFAGFTVTSLGTTVITTIVDSKAAQTGIGSTAVLQTYAALHTLKVNSVSLTEQGRLLDRR